MNIPTEPFVEFNKIARISREAIITEKIDGTNATVYIVGKDIFAGSRSRWITPEMDNHGFARWVEEHKDDLMNLGEGLHRGEWWGSGINRSYGLKEKRFSLFNTSRWAEQGKSLTQEKQCFAPACCHVVPILYQGLFSTERVDYCLGDLNMNGSIAAPGFKNPEGIVVYHTAANFFFKKTIEHDEVPKSKVK